MSSTLVCQQMRWWPSSRKCTGWLKSRSPKLSLQHISILTNWTRIFRDTLSRRITQLDFEVIASAVILLTRSVSKTWIKMKNLKKLTNNLWNHLISLAVDRLCNWIRWICIRKMNMKSWRLTRKMKCILHIKLAQELD